MENAQCIRAAINSKIVVVNSKIVVVNSKRVVCS